MSYMNKHVHGDPRHPLFHNNFTALRHWRRYSDVGWQHPKHDNKVCQGLLEETAAYLTRKEETAVTLFEIHNPPNTHEGRKSFHERLPDRMKQFGMLVYDFLHTGNIAKYEKKVNEVIVLRYYKIRMGLQQPNEECQVDYEV